MSSISRLIKFCNLKTWILGSLNYRWESCRFSCSCLLVGEGSVLGSCFVSVTRRWGRLLAVCLIFNAWIPKREYPQKSSAKQKGARVLVSRASISSQPSHPSFTLRSGVRLPHVHSRGKKFSSCSPRKKNAWSKVTPISANFVCRIASSLGDPIDWLLVSYSEWYTILQLAWQDLPQGLNIYSNPFIFFGSVLFRFRWGRNRFQQVPMNAQSLFACYSPFNS